MKVVEIPVRKVCAKFAGQQVDVLLPDGFWVLRDDSISADAAQTITHPFKELFVNLTTDNDDIYFRLVPSVPSNEGQGENGTDVHFDSYGNNQVK